jgi:putative hydrolase of the HAD superfamily
LKKILVFDLYNTLLEIRKPTQPLMQLYRQLELDITSQEFRQKALTQPLSSVLSMPAIANTGIDLTAVNEQLEQELASVRLFPETLEVLTQLSQTHTLYLISNLATPYIQPYADLGLAQFFTQAIFSCEVGYAKPDKAIFEWVPHSPADEVTMIGDSWRADMQGAQAVGWEYWWLQRKQKFNPEKRIIASLSDLLFNT